MALAPAPWPLLCPPRGRWHRPGRGCGHTWHLLIGNTWRVDGSTGHTCLPLQCHVWIPVTSKCQLKAPPQLLRAWVRGRGESKCSIVPRLLVKGLGASIVGRVLLYDRVFWLSLNIMSGHMICNQTYYLPTNRTVPTANPPPVHVQH